MLSKIFLTLAIAVIALIVLPRLLRRRSSGPLPPVRVQDLIQCPSCGTYRGRYDRCECGFGPTSGK